MTKLYETPLHERLREYSFLKLYKGPFQSLPGESGEMIEEKEETMTGGKKRKRISSEEEGSGSESKRRKVEVATAERDPSGLKIKISLPSSVSRPEKTSEGKKSKPKKKKHSKHESKDEQPTGSRKISKHHKKGRSRDGEEHKSGDKRNHSSSRSSSQEDLPAQGEIMESQIPSTSESIQNNSANKTNDELEEEMHKLMNESSSMITEENFEDINNNKDVNLEVSAKATLSSSSEKACTSSHVRGLTEPASIKPISNKSPNCSVLKADPGPSTQAPVGGGKSKTIVQISTQVKVSPPSPAPVKEILSSLSSTFGKKSELSREAQDALELYRRKQKLMVEISTNPVGKKLLASTKSQAPAALTEGSTLGTRFKIPKTPVSSSLK